MPFSLNTPFTCIYRFCESVKAKPAWPAAGMPSTAKRTNAERKNKEIKEFVLTDVTSSREEKRMTEESNMITLFTLIMLVFTCAAKNLISVLLRLFALVYHLFSLNNTKMKSWPIYVSDKRNQYNLKAYAKQCLA